MNKLTKSQKDEFATAFAMLCLYDGGVSYSLIQLFEYQYSIMMYLCRSHTALFLPRIFIISKSHLTIEQAEITPDQINTLLTATGNTEVEAFYPIIFANYLSDPDKFAQLIAFPTSGSGGGGGGGGGAAEAAPAAAAKEEEKEEEVEMDLGGGMDMFGGEEAAGGGDY